MTTMRLLQQRDKGHHTTWKHDSSTSLLQNIVHPKWIMLSVGASADHEVQIQLNSTTP
jgi:hypothetical protein